MNRREQEDAAARWARSVLEAGAAGCSRGADAVHRPAGWRERWAALEMPPPPAAAGFARRVAGAWAAERASVAAPILGATWMRAAALAALLAGIALGSTLSPGSGVEVSADSSETWSSTSLSEDYLTALAAPEATLAAPPAGDAAPASAP